MQVRTCLSLLVVLFLAVACAPLPPLIPPTAVPQPAAPPPAWQTYTNPVGFSIQYPSSWKQAELPPAATAQGAGLDGPEGTVELWWGTGFGGACPEGTSTVKVAQGELPACHTVGADGINHWEQINKELATTSFSGRAYTRDSTQASADAVLAVLATLAFEAPAAVAAPAVVQGVAPAPAPKSNPAATNCINVGGTPKTETRPDGGQYGVCYFGDNYVCEQWALMHGECPVGGVKMTGYNTPGARYCAITGGTYTPVGMTNTGQEAGNCTLPGGKVCDAGDYFNGMCTSSDPQPAPPTAIPPIGMPNPASGYCTSVGGTLKIEQRSDVGQMGVCYFPDNRQCEEWALEQGYCPVGGVKVTGYNTEAARYCAITGGKYTPTGVTPDGYEDGTCRLPGGEVCGAWQYYNGYCGTTY